MPTFKVALIREEEGRYSVQVPALPGCFTCGDTREEAIEMARDAIALYLEELAAQGRPIPQDEVEALSLEVASPSR